MNLIVTAMSLASATAFAEPSIVPATSIAALSPDNPDAELVALCQETLTAWRNMEAAIADSDAAEETYKARTPMRPAALRWNPTDPIGNELEYTGHKRAQLWCNSEQIEERRNVPCTREEFIGTHEEWDLLPVDAPPPPDLQARLFAQIPNETDQKRFDEILAAHDAYTAQLAALRRDTGLDAADAHYDEACARYNDLEQRVIDSTAATVDGIRAKAIVAAETKSDDLAWSIIDDMVAAA